jgi:hypothetical protein
LYPRVIHNACSCLWLCLLTSTLAPASARAFNCCSVAKTGFSLCGAGGDCWSRESSGSAGVTEDVDFRGGIFVGLGLVGVFVLVAWLRGSRDRGVDDVAPLGYRIESRSDFFL